MGTRRKALLIVAGILGMLACDYVVSKVAGDAMGNIADKTVTVIEGGGFAERRIGSPFALQENMTSVNGVPPYVHSDSMFFPENVGRNAAYYRDMIFLGLVAVEGWIIGLYELLKNSRSRKV
jgi:hypothetical protein